MAGVNGKVFEKLWDLPANLESSHEDADGHREAV